MLTFAAAVFFLLITPGPGVLSAAGVGSGFGFRPGITYLVGLFAGSNGVGFAVISGLATMLEVYPSLRIALILASGAYLLYLAAKIAFAGSRIAFIHSETPPGFWGGVALQAINPKAYVVNTALFAGFPFMPGNLLVEIVVKLLIINAIWIPIHVLWLATGVGIRRLALPRRVQFIVNMTMAVSMLLVVGLAALAQG